MHKVLQFTLERGHPYATVEFAKLNNFVSGELVEEKGEKAGVATD